MRRISALAAAVCLAGSTVGHSLHNNIFERSPAPSSTPTSQGNSCPDDSYIQCQNPGVPSNFCCSNGSTCLSLAGNTTVLCCPAGVNCTTIQTISCDISLQNVALHPDNNLKTTALNSILPACGTECCPFGYSCDGSGNCVYLDNLAQEQAPSSSSSAIPSSTSSPNSAFSQTAASPIPTTCPQFPTTAVLVGFFPGLAAGILLSVASICFLGARRRRAARRLSGSSFGNIGDPQPINPDMRTDFLRKPPSSPSTLVNETTPRRQNTVQRVRSLFSKSSPSSPRTPHGTPPMPMREQQQQQPPRTPILQREPSYEDINIFADTSALSERGGSARKERPGHASRQTTFTDMMERSGLGGVQNGQRESLLLPVELGS